MTKDSKPSDSRPILTLMQDLRFECHPGLSCFNSCCRNVNIFLTPSDVLKMKRRLNMTSTDFLEQYTVSLVSPSTGLPMVALKMKEDETKECHFITPEGCSIYSDRPWSCRMYPLDYDPEEDHYRVIADPSKCRGLNTDKTIVVEDWLASQGILFPWEMDRLFNEAMLRLEFPKDKIENPKITQMIYMASYDLDSFRRFVFESRFLKIFDISEGILEKVKTDDEELARLGLLWLKFGMSDKNALQIRPEVLAEQGQAQ